MKSLTAMCLAMLMAIQMLGQETQIIKGTVIDKDTRQPVVGATVLVMDSNPVIGAITGATGEFKLNNVPVGRQTVRCTFLGYGNFLSDNLIVNSAKETVLDIEMTEVVTTTKEVVIRANETPNQAINPMQVVSTRSFSVNETQRYAGSVNDPGRMAVGFAGVQSIKDNSSELLIRGNSALGVLWRLEGIDIPNPNHFARPGSSGGGISVFSAQLLANSDFSTGAFAAEYGNAISGVFDMKFRHGNRENREYRFKLGLLGIDFAAEGPFKKGGGSYLVNYRYSTLGILNDAGFRLVGERIDNNFQDLSFNLYFPSKDNKTYLTLFGIGGLSEELWDPVEDVDSWRYPSTDYETMDFQTDMGAIGMTLTRLLDEKSYLKLVVAASGNRITIQDDTLTRDLAATTTNLEDYTDGRISAHALYNRKINNRLTLRSGLIANRISYDFQHRQFDNNFQALTQRVDGNGNTMLMQAYSQMRIRANEKTALNVGVHGTYLPLNDTWSLEPRLSLKHQLNNSNSLSLAYGLHSQMLPLGNYFTEILAETTQQRLQPNLNLDLLKSHHLVGAYSYIGQGTKLQVEAYFQRLFNVPVHPTPSPFWLLNERDGYATDGLVSEGTGLNYGLDITYERFFSKGLFYLLSASVFKSTYETLDGETYNTRYDNNFGLNGMIGKEWAFKNGGLFQIGGRVIYGGGLRYTPGDPTLSARVGDYVPDDSRTYEEQVPDYFRIDARLAFRKSLKKIAYTLSFDAQNVTNRENVRDEIYDPGLNALTFRFQSGLIPVFSFQVDF